MQNCCHSRYNSSLFHKTNPLRVPSYAIAIERSVSNWKILFLHTPSAPHFLNFLCFVHFHLVSLSFSLALLSFSRFLFFFSLEGLWE